MSRNDSGTIQNYTTVTTDDNGNVVLGSADCPVCTTTGASFTDTEATLPLDRFLAVLGCDRNATLTLWYQDHNQVTRPWPGKAWAAHKALFRCGRTGTWRHGLQVAIAGLLARANDRPAATAPEAVVVVAPEALVVGDAPTMAARPAAVAAAREGWDREAAPEAVDWATFGLAPLPGISGACYAALVVAGRFVAQHKQNVVFDTVVDAFPPDVLEGRESCKGGHQWVPPRAAVAVADAAVEVLRECDYAKGLGGDSHLLRQADGCARAAQCWLHMGLAHKFEAREALQAAWEWFQRWELSLSVDRGLGA